MQYAVYRYKHRKVPNQSRGVAKEAKNRNKKRGGEQADQCWRGCMPRHALLLVENVPRIMALPTSFPNLIAGESRR